MTITAGTYRARVTGECILGASKQKGTPFIEFYLTIIDGESKGEIARWTGYFSENTNERSIESLQICGWQGDDLSEFSDGKLHGLDANDVSIVVELETYTVKEGVHAGEERTSPRVSWINRFGGFLNVAAKMDAGAAAAFGAKMRGLVMKSKAKSPTPMGAKAVGQAMPAAPDGPEDDGIPF